MTCDEWLKTHMPESKNWTYEERFAFRSGWMAAKMDVACTNLDLAIPAREAQPA